MTAAWEQLKQQLQREREQLQQGGGKAAAARQHEKNRLTARERLARMLDPGAPFHEIGLYAAWGMYEEWGGAPAAGVVCGLGRIAGRWVMVIANDATVKAGAFFPMTA
ncbi:MAG: carboxyl transferase domain-containing protein, partial [Terriglobia bacterium]